MGSAGAETGGGVAGERNIAPGLPDRLLELADLVGGGGLNQTLIRSCPRSPAPHVSKRGFLAHIGPEALRHRAVPGCCVTVPGSCVTRTDPGPSPSGRDPGRAAPTRGQDRGRDSGRGQCSPGVVADATGVCVLIDMVVLGSRSKS